MAIAEFCLEGTLERANDNYLKIFGYTHDRAVGMHHREFCLPVFVQSSQYASFWQQLRAGHAHAGQVERICQDGRSCWLEATYTPILDENGQTLKILKIGTCAGKPFTSPVHGCRCQQLCHHHQRSKSKYCVCQHRVQPNVRLEQ